MKSYCRIRMVKTDFLKFGSIRAHKAEKKARADQAAEEAQKVLLQLGNLPQSPQIAPAVEALPLNGAVMESLMNHTLQTVIPSKDLNLPAAWKADPQCLVRYDPVGLDRRLNRYWTFTNDINVTDDPCSRCLFVESHPDGEFKLVETSEQLEGLKRSLDTRGIREGSLLSALSKEADRCSSTLEGWRENLGEWFYIHKSYQPSTMRIERS